MPTSHVRAEELSKLGRTDVRIISGRLLITIDIPLLDKSGYQLYEMYAHPVYQQISPNTMGSIYIIPKTPYIALPSDERKFFLISKEYYNNCQKTFYNTICENTQSKHEVSTTTSCKCLMLITPSKDTIHLCDIRMKVEEEMYGNYIPSLSAWIYLTKNPKPISINCVRGKIEKGYLSNSGLLRLGTGCTARTKYTTLTGTHINKRTEEYIYNPNFTFNITEILPKLDRIRQLPKIKPFTWQKSHIGNWKRLHTDESLSTIEEELTEFEEQNFNKQIHS